MERNSINCGTDESAETRSIDWVADVSTYSLAWVLPLTLLPLGLLVSPSIRMIAWAVALAW
jgi:hypothetical protein